MSDFRRFLEKKPEKMIFLGLMSGTSLDGLDAVFCTFESSGNHYSYRILFAETLEYDEEIRMILLQAPNVTAYELVLYDRKYGKYIGEKVCELIARSGIAPDIVASHGHTIFHVPHEQVTFQIGHGASISAVCNLPVMSDFRSLDVALGGQGAPLVPIGDQLLFPEFDACLNLGGFANVSLKQNDRRVAWDVCPVNFIANYLAEFKGMNYDTNGYLGASGKIIPELLEQMETLSFYQKKYPKSLGREWVEKHFIPLLDIKNQSIEDLLRTFYEHVSLRISSDINFGKGMVLCTGGGAKNSFLMKLIAEKAVWEPIVPNVETVDFKEALIFAFLCFLKISGQNNCLSSVTGALRDNISGSLV